MLAFNNRAGGGGVVQFWGRCKYVPVALYENIPVFRNPKLYHTSTPSTHFTMCLTVSVQNQKQEKN